MNQQTTAFEDDSFWANGWSLRIAQLLARTIGLVLIIAASLKTTDMQLFVGQMRAYGVISHPVLLILGAWTLILAEFTLGAALLVYYQARLTASIVMSLFVIFIGANIWAWVTSVTDDCGCFGTWLVRTPGEALIEDVFLLAALIPTWLSPKRPRLIISRIKIGLVVVALLAGLIMPIAISGHPRLWIDPPRMNDIEAEITILQIQGVTGMDLKHGDYLIVLMLTDCIHCQESVPALCDLAEQPGLPRLIALSPNDEEQRKAFNEIFNPSYPIGQVDLHVFLRLLGDSDVPRVILIRDGRVLHIWDEEIPDVDRIVQAL